MTYRSWPEPEDENGAAPAPRGGALRYIGGLAGWVVVGLFVLLLVVSPLPMGANRDWAWSPMAVVVGILAVLGAAGLGTHHGFKFAADERLPLLALIGCFAVYIAVAFLQMSTLVVPRGAAALYGQAAAILGQAHAAVATLAIDASREVLLKSLACALIFVIARAMSADQRRARALLYALVVCALVVVAYALLMQATTHSCYLGSYLKKQFDYNPAADHCLMSGTFVNSNSFGCFMGMALVAAVALLFGGERTRRAELDYGEEESPLNWLTGRRLVLIALAIVFMGCLLISGSRGGFGATMFGVVALLFLLLRESSGGVFQLRRTVVIGVLFSIVVGLIAGGAMVQKMSTLAQGGSANRIAIWRTSLEAIGQSPWLGWGLGSYPDIYTMLQPPEVALPNDKAHSTPLETVVEVGIPAAVPTLMIVLLPWIMCVRRQINRYGSGLSGREDLAHLLIDVKRRLHGGSSVCVG